MNQDAIMTTIFGLLIALLGWNASQAHKRLDKAEEAMHNLTRSMPNDFLGKVDFRASEDRMEKRVERIEKTIESAFTEFWRKFDAVLNRIQDQIDNKQDRK